MIKISRAQSIKLMISICLVSWMVTAIDPFDAEAWLLEQIAPALVVGGLWVISRYITLSTASLWGLTCLFIAHTIGTHYTYSLTPYDLALERVLGVSINELFGWQRNHYDRFVHFGFGVATALPLFELLKANRASWIAWLLSMNVVISLSAIYELLEWLAAIVFSNESGDLYLGSQGDIWDAQADIALAWLGFIITYVVWTFARGRFFRYPQSRKTRTFSDTAQS